MLNINEARAALNAALASQNPVLIAAARQALATAEDGEDESVDGQKAKKMKKAKKAEEPEAEEPEAEDMEGEAEGEESEDEEPHEEPDGDEEPTETEDAEEGEDAEEDEEEEPATAKEARKAKKAKSPYEGSKAAKGSVGRLLAVLGAKTMAEAIGRAAAASEAMASVEKLSRRLLKLEREKKASKVDGLFRAAQREGRVVRAEVGPLKAAFAGRPIAELRAYLAAKPRVVASEFAQESAVHYPSAPAGAFATPGASKAMAAFGVTPEQIAKRAAERGLNPGFPGGSDK